MKTLDSTKTINYEPLLSTESARRLPPLFTSMISIFGFTHCFFGGVAVGIDVVMVVLFFILFGCARCRTVEIKNCPKIN